MPLKFEGKFNVGQTIRSYDFPPMEGRTDQFIEGEIVRINDSDSDDFKSYSIVCKFDSVNYRNPRVGCMFNIPMEIWFCEHDNRITLVQP